MFLLLMSVWIVTIFLQQLFQKIKMYVSYSHFSKCSANIEIYKEILILTKF